MRFLLPILIICTVNCFGQNYGNVWCFGKYFLMDFSNCNPNVTITSSTSAIDGSATISDSNGNLLFYTSSDVVYSNNHQIMQNGWPLCNIGLSQTIIIQKPLTNNIYYILTVHHRADSISDPFEYHEVDMSLNAGLGSVTSKHNLIDSSITTEQVAATWHSNGTDIWIMTHEYGTNRFKAFLVTQTGINLTPIISSVGSAHIPIPQNWNARGQIKFSPNGNKLAFTANGQGPVDTTSIVELFDFDNTSGIVSNVVPLPIYGGDFCVSFSPDNSKLYCGTNKNSLTFAVSDSNYLYQYNLSSNDSSTIVNSGVLIDKGEISEEAYLDIKIGPDGKLYITNLVSQYMGIINNPNSVGLLCNYNNQGIWLSGNVMTSALNHYIEYTNYCTPNGENELNYNSSISLFPNPVIDYLTIENTDKKYDLTVFNPIGEIIYRERNVSKNMNQLDCRVFPKGLILVRIETDSEIINRKIIVN